MGVRGEPFNQVIMKLFTLLVVLMASMAAIEAAPMDEDPMGDFMEDPEESMDYEADSIDKESMGEEAAESDNEKDESEDEEEEPVSYAMAKMAEGYEEEPLTRRKRSTYSQAYQYPQYGYDPYLALRSYSSYNPYNQGYRSYIPSHQQNQAYRSYISSYQPNQAYRSLFPSHQQNQAYRSYISSYQPNQAYRSLFPAHQ